MSIVSYYQGTTSMKVQYEIEYKCLLNPAKAKELLALALFSFKAKQTNTYYDDYEHFFTKQKIVLRIRTKNNQIIFTQKQVSEAGLLESEFNIDTPSMDDLKIHTFLKSYKRQFKWTKLGQSMTQRYIFDDEFGQWCLDFNHFDHVCDVELEYELFEGIKDKEAHFLNQLKTWGIPHVTAQSKFARMLAYKELIKLQK